MNKALRMIRRDFVKRSAAVAGGLGVIGLRVQAGHADDLPAETTGTLEAAYLGKGLNALARAHHMSSMAGHLGASLIAGYYVSAQRPSLDPHHQPCRCHHRSR